MKRSAICKVLPIVLAMALSVACSKQPSADASGQQQQGSSDSSASSSGPAAVPAGTPISIRLQSTISSGSAHEGDAFEAVVQQPVVVRGETIIAKGAPVTGRVLSAEAAGHLHHPAFLQITLASVEIDGKKVPVKTASISVHGQNHNKRNVEMIGGGAGAGALIGALAGGGKGALIGSAVGAGAGTGAAYATGKKDVGFAAERVLTFKLTQSVSPKN